VLETTLQRQEPMNLSRLQRRSSDVKIGSWTRNPEDGPLAPAEEVPLRVAMVFSNDYASTGDYVLPNTAADGENVTAALAASGYMALHVRNSDEANFRASLQTFRKALDKAGPASVGVIYFAGYGASLGGSNYLIPDGALPRTAEDIVNKGIGLSDLVSDLEASEAQAVVIVVDCGRSYDSQMDVKGFEPGFASYTAGANVVIAYADAPGTTRANAKAESEFAKAFAHRVRSDARIDLNEAMQRITDDVRLATDDRQRPWFQSSVSLPIFFRADIAPEEEAPPPIAIDDPY